MYQYFCQAINKLNISASLLSNEDISDLFTILVGIKDRENKI